MAEERIVSGEQVKTSFLVSGVEVDAHGKEKGQSAVAGDLTAAQARIAELEAQLAGSDGPQEGDADQRTKAQLGAALTEKGVTYDTKANRPALLALATEHGV